MIARSANSDKKIHSIESIETYAYEISEQIIHENEKMKDKNITR